MSKGDHITKRVEAKFWGLPLPLDLHPMGQRGGGAGLAFPSQTICPSAVQLIPIPVDSALLLSALNCCLTLDLHGKLNYAPKTLIA